jgi:REP element-mobilizing transposase RayT
MRYWLLTWTTYGTWLPGDERGCVTRVRTDDGPRVLHHEPGAPVDGSMPGLRRSAQAQMRGEPVLLDEGHATVLVEQFRETAAVRGWSLIAVAIMPNHCHVVLAVDGDPDPADLLRDLKSHGSRALNRRWSKPKGGTWWTESGSRRKLPDNAAIGAATRYVVNQYRPLLVWTADSDPSERPGERGA